MNADDYENFINEKFAEVAAEAKAKTGVVSISTTCRPEIMYLGGIICSRKTK
jgi:hypothetical protein